MKTALKNPLVGIEFAKARMRYFVEAQKYKRGLPGIRISREVRLHTEAIPGKHGTTTRDASEDDKSC